MFDPFTVRIAIGAVAKTERKVISVIEGINMGSAYGLNEENKDIHITHLPMVPHVEGVFEGEKIKFENIDVSSDQNAVKEMVKKSGQMGTPVIDIEGKIIVGFDRRLIEKELGLK